MNFKFNFFLNDILSGLASFIDRNTYSCPKKKKENDLISIDKFIYNDLETSLDLAEEFKDNVFKEVYNFKKLFLDNSDKIKIAEKINSSNFFEIYGLLFNPSYYITLNDEINRTLPLSYLQYLNTNSNDLKERLNIIKNTLSEIKILYLWKYLTIENDIGESYNDLRHLNPEFIINDLDNVQISRVDVNILAQLCIYYYHAYNDCLENTNYNDLINFKEETFKIEESNNTIMAQNNLFVARNLNQNVNNFQINNYTTRKVLQDVDNYNLRVNGIILNPTFKEKFNFFLWKFLNNKFFSINLVHWFFIINLENTNNFKKLLQLIFNINEGQEVILLSKLKEFEFTFTSENIEVLKEMFGNDFVPYNPGQNFDDPNFRLRYPILTSHLNLIKKMEVLNIYNLNDFNYINFVNLIKVSPIIDRLKLDDNNSLFDIKNFKNLLEKNLVTKEKIKVYNSLKLINNMEDNKDLLNILDNNLQYKYYNINFLTEQEFKNLFCHKILYEFIQEKLRSIGLSFSLGTEVLTTDLTIFLNNIFYPFYVLKDINSQAKLIWNNGNPKIKI